MAHAKFEGHPPKGTDIPEPEEWGKEPDLTVDEVEDEGLDLDETVFPEDDTVRLVEIEYVEEGEQEP